MTSVVQQHDIESPIVILKDIDAAIMLLDTPEMRIVQAEDGATENPIEGDVANQNDGLIRVLPNHLSDRCHTSFAQFSQALTTGRTHGMWSDIPGSEEIGIALFDLSGSEPSPFPVVDIPQALQDKHGHPEGFGNRLSGLPGAGEGTTIYRRNRQVGKPSSNGASLSPADFVEGHVYDSTEPLDAIPLGLAMADQDDRRHVRFSTP